MLRWLVILLLLANLGFWAWHQPVVVEALGLPHSSDREPERLNRQIRPEAIRVLPASAASGPVQVGSSVEAASRPASAAPAADSGPTACLETNPLTTTQVPQATKALQLAGVNPGGWIEIRREIPGRWVIAMGRFESREQMQRKSAELQRLQISYTEATGELSPGLQLGEFSSVGAAQDRLAQLQNRGVRTARVVGVAEARTEVRVRADKLGNSALNALRAQPTSGTLRWRACEDAKAP